MRERETDRERDRVIADRLLLTSSLLLVVLTVAFAAFMDAEKFWDGQSIAANMRLHETNLPDSVRKAVEGDRDHFDEQRRDQLRSARIFAGMMAVLMTITALAVPAGIFDWPVKIVRFLVPLLVALVLLLALVTAVFALGIWNP